MDSEPSHHGLDQLDLLRLDANTGDLRASDVQQIARSASHFVRTIRRRDGLLATSRVEALSDAEATSDLRSGHDLSWLRATEWPCHDTLIGTVRSADIFAGCGAMSLGLWEACRALQLQLLPRVAMEFDEEKLAVFAKNFPSSVPISTPVEELVDGALGSPPTKSERALRDRIGPIDIVVGGPPCQGHSDLNNHTRRADPRNSLVLRVVRFVEVFRPEHIIIENVQGVRHDKGRSFSTTHTYLARLGYHVDQGLIDCSEVGVPQARRRFFLIASRTRHVSIAKLVAASKEPKRNLAWACQDLLGRRAGTTFDTSAVHARANQHRIEYLFRNNLYDLPDEVRPDCHRLKNHAYRAVYGRMYWDQPAPTITTGFGSTGQGRFVHPKEPRTLTPHEAARLQMIPDFFQFGGAGRTQLQKMIGNAVPPKICYLLALELLR